MFHFILYYKVIILLVWFLYEIKSPVWKEKNKYKFEIGTSSLTDFGGGSCAFAFSHIRLRQEAQGLNGFVHFIY